MTVGLTTAEPEVPDAAKPLPAQDVAWVEDQVRVEDCPAATDLGFAESAAVGAGGGVVKEPAVQGVSEPLPQHVLKTFPLTGADGFEVSPQGSCSIIPFAASDRFGFVPLASTGS